MAHASFVKKTANKQVGLDIQRLLGLNPTKGDIGLEIECEGNKFNKSNDLLPNQWCCHQDGSLRGKDNAEYVLRKPIPFDGVPSALDSLWNDMAKYGTVLDVSMRTSVHVHLNCQSFHLNRLASFGALYFAVEEILTEWCGDHRVGNLFCLRAKDAPSIITAYRMFIRNDGRWPLTEGLHYAGLNLSALTKFGSLEVRTLRGVTDKAVIQDWVDILRRIYTLSADYPDPREIIAMFSAEGPLQFFNLVLGDKAETVLNGIEMDETQLRDSLYEGIRFAQDIAYSRDWAMYAPIRMEPDPFGRDSKKMAAKLAVAGNGSLNAAGQALTDEYYAAQLDALENYVDAPQTAQVTPNTILPVQWVTSNG